MSLTSRLVRGRIHQAMTTEIDPDWEFVLRDPVGEVDVFIFRSRRQNTPSGSDAYHPVKYFQVEVTEIDPRNHG